MAECGCGRSATGKCVGWHGLSEEQYQEKKQPTTRSKLLKRLIINTADRIRAQSIPPHNSQIYTRLAAGLFIRFQNGSGLFLMKCRGSVF